MNTGKHWCSSKQRKTNELLHWTISILEILFETITIKWEKRLVVIMNVSLSQNFKIVQHVKTSGD
jgi:hypothetical protein